MSESKHTTEPVDHPFGVWFVDYDSAGACFRVAKITDEDGYTSYLYVFDHDDDARQLAQAFNDNDRIEAINDDLLAACEAADRILWMAEAYAEAGGTHGPEMRDYNEAAPLIKAAIAKARTK
jgi:heptaprenylglyceryl phosphate synthase